MTTSLSHLALLSLGSSGSRRQPPSHWVALLSLSVLAIGCQRPSLGGVQTLDCGAGDRVVSLSRVFCVYDQSSTSGGLGGGGAGVTGGAAGGTSATGQAGAEANQPEVTRCPEALPYAYQFAGLMICSREGTLSPSVIEAAAATWASEYGQTQPSVMGGVGGAAQGGTAGQMSGAQAGEQVEGD